MNDKELTMEEITEEETNKQRVEVMMPLDAVTGRYTNFLRIGNSASEFVLDFCLMENFTAHSVSRIIINPMNIKSYIDALKKNVDKYEAKYNITLPETVEEFVARGILKKD